MSSDNEPVKDASAEVPRPDGPPEGVPGRPSSGTPSVEEPTEPRPPLPPKHDQRAPEPVSPTGRRIDADPACRSQAGRYLTTAQGTRLADAAVVSSTTTTGEVNV